jgi:hypothetical protein
MDGITGNVGGRKEWKAHDVVPVHVGHEKMIFLRGLGPMLLHDMLSKTAQASTHITQHVRLTPDHLEA